MTVAQAGGGLQRAFRGSADSTPDLRVKHKDCRRRLSSPSVPRNTDTGAEPHVGAAPRGRGTWSPEDPQTPPPSSRLQVPAEALGLLRSQTALPGDHVVPILPSLKHQLVLLLHV